MSAGPIRTRVDSVFGPWTFVVSSRRERRAVGSAAESEREKEGRIRVKLYVISRLACRYSTPVYPSHPIPFHDLIALTLLSSTCILPAGPFHQHAYRASRPRPPTVSFPSSQRFDPSTRYQHLIPARPAHRTLPEAPLPFVFAFCRYVHVYAATLTLVSAHLTQQSLMCIAERMSMPNRAR